MFLFSNYCQQLFLTKSPSFWVAALLVKTWAFSCDYDARILTKYYLCHKAKDTVRTDGNNVTEFIQKQVRLGNSFQSLSDNFKALQLLIPSVQHSLPLSCLSASHLAGKAKPLTVPGSRGSVVPELHIWRFKQLPPPFLEVEE